MGRRVVPVNWMRLALGLAVPAALVVAGSGAVLAAAGPAGAATSSCTVSWVGKGIQPTWTNPKNWSTGKVPGASDDVCITATGVDVLTPVSITVHSLLIGGSEGIALEGTPSGPVTATVATSVTMSSGGLSRIDMTDATIKASTITNQGGTIFTDGNCELASPGISFSAGGALQAANGTTTLTSLQQLSNGILSGIKLSTAGAVVVLPGDITHLAGANLVVGGGSAIDAPAGHNALAGLTAIDSQSSFADDNNLTLASDSFTADGNVSLGDVVFALGGPYTQAQGTLALGGSTVFSASQVTIAKGAALSGGGSIEENLVNNGSVIAGRTTLVNGSYAQAPGASLASGFGGLLSVNGTATLAGSVTASELVTHTGDTTQLITFSTLSGGFTAHSLGLKLITRANEIDAIVLPQLAVSPKTVAPGGTVTVNGGGFTYPQSVRIFLDKASGTPLGTTGVGIRGAFTTTVTIPASTAAGTHRLIAVESDGNRASASIMVS